MIARLFLVFVTLMLLSVTAKSGEWEDAVTAYEKKNYAVAFAKFRKLEESGNNSASLVIAMLYSEGRGVKKDCKEALRRYKAAAELRNPVALYSLGVKYRDGECALQDSGEAIKFFKLAAEAGYQLAFLTLGDIFSNDLIYPRDFTRAHMWYNLGAEHGQSSCGMLRDSLQIRMKGEQVLEAQKLAKKCLESNYKDCD